MSRASDYIDRVMADKDRAPKMAPTNESVTMMLCGTSKNCDHDFKGWREFEDGRGGEQVCTKCGMGAMAYTLSLDI